jgi:tetratricopeptide (TPR) repeat protein
VTMTKEAEIRQFLNRAGNNLPAIDQAAFNLYQMRYPLEPALRAYKKYLVRKPKDATAAFNYAYYLGKDGQFEAAIRMYKRSLELGISAPEEVLLNIANIYTDHLRNNEQAKVYLHKALKRRPDYASAFHNLGNLSEQDGNREEAAQYFEKCLEIDPSNETALARLADTHKFVEKDDPLLTRLINVAKRSNDADVHMALGKAYEQIAEFELAWRHFSMANAQDERVLPVYRQAATESVFDRIKSICTNEWLASYQGQAREPVFICGMFRTGSTLLEQVLAAHPAFVAGGESEFFPRLVAKEFPAYPQGLESISSERLNAWAEAHEHLSEELAGKTARLTDKRPDNFLHIGLIKAILPSAKFVVTERDWRDVSTSIFSTRLGITQNNATSLENIRHYIELQKELVDHWQSILGSDLIRVQYENLVSEPRSVISAVLEFLGEPWDERCLNYHKLDNAVQTASVWQVREPFHTKSIGRWKNYRQQFIETFGTELNS